MRNGLIDALWTPLQTWQELQADSVLVTRLEEKVYLPVQIINSLRWESGNPRPPFLALSSLWPWLSRADSQARNEGMGRGPEKPLDFVTLVADKDCSSDPSADQCQRTWVRMRMHVCTCVHRCILALLKYHLVFLKFFLKQGLSLTWNLLRKLVSPLLGLYKYPPPHPRFVCLFVCLFSWDRVSR